MQLSSFRWEQSKPLAVSFSFTLSGQRVAFSLSHLTIGSFKRPFEDEVVFPKKPTILTVCPRTVSEQSEAMVVDALHIVRLDSYGHCSPCTLPMVFITYLVIVIWFSLADKELSLIQMIFFSGFVLFLLIFCIIDYMSGKSLEDNQVKCESNHCWPNPLVILFCFNSLLEIFNT